MDLRSHGLELGTRAMLLGGICFGVGGGIQGSMTQGSIGAMCAAGLLLLGVILLLVGMALVLFRKKPAPVEVLPQSSPPAMNRTTPLGRVVYGAIVVASLGLGWLAWADSSDVGSIVLAVAGFPALFSVVVRLFPSVWAWLHESDQKTGVRRTPPE